MNNAQCWFCNQEICKTFIYNSTTEGKLISYSCESCNSLLWKCGEIFDKIFLYLPKFNSGKYLDSTPMIIIDLNNNNVKGLFHVLDRNKIAFNISAYELIQLPLNQIKSLAYEKINKLAPFI